MSETWGRREFIRIASLGPLGLSLGDYLSLRAQSQTQSDKSCIMIVLDSGMSHIDTFDMKPDAPSGVRGTFNSMATKVAGIHICEHLPRTAQQMDKFAILRSVWGRTAIHFNGVYFLMTGYLPIQSMEFPSMGSVVAKELGLRKGMPPYVLNAMLDHAMGPGFLGSAYAPFWVRSDPNAPDFRVEDLDLPVDVDWKTVSDRRALVKQMDEAFRARDTQGITESRDSFYVEAERIMRSPAVKKAFDIWAEPEPLRDRYGRTPIGQGCLLARRLVESGVRFVTVNAARAIWDTHGDNFNRFAKSPPSGIRYGLRCAAGRFGGSGAAVLHSRGSLRRVRAYTEDQRQCGKRSLASRVFRAAGRRRGHRGTGVWIVGRDWFRAQGQPNLNGRSGRNNIRSAGNGSSEGIPRTQWPADKTLEQRRSNSLTIGIDPV